ncbi:hypothetical protein D0N36_17345 [Hymenobacter lapidiphilus]|uniref:hypothetical protein n=1 Tax=Hymenobacter sp. CCM 8763 TaxID=2303334 RepID=UPI000E3447ED|nr:hypothetical protein [Hymenobacter sp. CCM 8763]RFP63825.1 hypothetical protein D0N36_17345 [Hymenobacter sp. CCM 8763]
MNYSEEFLTQLAQEEVSGDFPPFSSGSISQVKKYIKTIIGRIKDDYQLVVEPDFSYHGSGYGSYISVLVAKKEAGKPAKLLSGTPVNDTTNGLLLYISNLVPYWYYGDSGQWEILSDGKVTSSLSGFLRPESIHEVDDTLWRRELAGIKAIFEQYRYSLLTEQELQPLIDFDIPLKAALVSKPYQVFDYFFHWTD